MASASPKMSPELTPVRSNGFSGDLLFALALYWLSTSVVTGGVLLGWCYIPFCEAHPSARQSPDFLAWDGVWYTRIANQGYSYNPQRNSSVAFFPAYPVLSSLVSGVTRLPVEISLLLVSNGSLILALFVLLRYLRLRFPEGPRRAWHYSLASAAFFPTTFYWRMAYTESLFLLLALVVFYGVERGWRPLYVALWIGLASATRLTGVALFVPLVYEVWRKNGLRPALKKLAVLAPVSIWGLALYIAYQAWEFGEPMAFRQTQVHWQERDMPDNFSAIFADFLTFEPIRGVYDSECECYWANDPPRDSAALSMQFMNPIYMLIAAGLLAMGWRSGWLNHKEVLTGLLLLLIAYVLQGYRTCMVSQARYASVVFPQFIVFGHLLGRLPTWLSVALLGASGGLLATYAAMFTSWYWYY